MAVALLWPPLPPPPSPPSNLALSSRRPTYCCTSTLSSQTDSIISSPPSTSTTCRPAVILPGLGNNTNDYQKLALILKDYGVPTAIANVSRVDWLRNAAGLLDANYWRGTLRPRPVLNWYLERVEAAVREAKELCPESALVHAEKAVKVGHDGADYLKAMTLLLNGDECTKEMAIQTMGRLRGFRRELFRAKDYDLLHRYIHNKAICIVGSTLSLIGHSAGGWLARVYLQDIESSDVSLLLTLGTPHLAPPKGVSGVIDQTRGLLDYVEKHCTKAVYTPELRYVCIAGRYIQGARLLGTTINGNSAVMADIDKPVEETATVVASAPQFATLQARFVGQGYKQVKCIDLSTFTRFAIYTGLSYWRNALGLWAGRRMGDGVVPEISAHLEGALNITLDGVYHSPVGADDETRPWYGSPAVVEQWIHHLLH